MTVVSIRRHRRTLSRPKELIKKQEELVSDLNDLKETKNDSIEIVTEEWIEEVADCDCAFNLTYKIKGLINKDYIITLNNKIIPKTKHRFKIRKDKPSFKIVNNDTILGLYYNLID